MNRTAYPLLLLILICSLVLMAPAGLLAAGALHADSSCQMGGRAMAPQPSCKHHNQANHSGTSSRERNLTCRSGGHLAFIAPLGISAPSWKAMTFTPAPIEVSSKPFALAIFHPPESDISG